MRSCSGTGVGTSFGTSGIVEPLQQPSSRRPELQLAIEEPPPRLRLTGLPVEWVVAGVGGAAGSSCVPQTGLKLGGQGVATAGDADASPSQLLGAELSAPRLDVSPAVPVEPRADTA